ncbi:dicarboxylate/amino acid:cation symporter [Geomicrobium sediminis]|uniref:Na+/H+-dicarboxylate symporter n=1 Tax=Geomicrobium sediminis TaxID=1347788 RepID=A0ABS2PC08_9BACL|nr:dicarboxylate/amino acid:cation symporter [Geomicrobium sediminis]MBM7632526.1 Na+/H+-dicarboxylate symporter [Geomicrobium sediminis]
MKLILKLLLGVIGGIVVGLIAVSLPSWVMDAIVTFQMIFGQFLGFIIPFVILFFITSGVASMGAGSGKTLGLTTGIAYTSSVLAGVFALVIALVVLPLFITESVPMVGEEAGFTPLFELEIDPALGVITALVMAFVFGIGIARTNSPTLKSFFDEGKNIIEKLLWKVVIPFLPFYIASIFAEMAADGTVWETLSSFALVLVLAIATHWLYLIGAFTIAGSVAGQNPFSALKNMLPAYFTGVGTMSSAATIPITVEATKKNRVRESMAETVIPLGANIHLAGSTITIVLAATTVMMMYGDLATPTVLGMLPFIFALAVIMIAAPGVPGGAVIASLGLLTTMLGFTEAAVGIMIAIYMAQDSFGTATNVTGDGAIALLVDRFVNGRHS